MMAKAPQILLPQGIIEVNRDKFQLKFFHRKWDEARYHLVKTYPVAVGMQGLETPGGYSAVKSKSRCPEWMVPDSQWAIDAGLVPGTILACDRTPDYSGPNPIKARWIGVTDPKGGVGIHGTSSIDSIGTAASHGCIRMRIPDVIELYDLVSRGDTINII